jgi:hypothetical protein
MTERRIIAIGSSKFKAEQLGITQRETLCGRIVLVTGFWHHVDMVPIDEEVKKFLDRLMLDKIAMATEVIVVDKNSYIGESTKLGIEHAQRLGKLIRYLSEEGS